MNVCSYFSYRNRDSTTALYFQRVSRVTVILKAYYREGHSINVFSKLLDNLWFIVKFEQPLMILKDLVNFTRYFFLGCHNQFLLLVINIILQKINYGKFLSNYPYFEWQVASFPAALRYILSKDLYKLLNLAFSRDNFSHQSVLQCSTNVIITWWMQVEGNMIFLCYSYCVLYWVFME